MNVNHLLHNYPEAVAVILFGIGFSNLLLQKNLIKKENRTLKHGCGDENIIVLCRLLVYNGKL